MRFNRLLGILIVSGLLTASVFAGNGNSLPSGSHWQFNMIGHPKNVEAIGGDNSNGRAIMIPLQNANGPDAIVCEEEQIILKDDLAPTWTDQEPTGAKLYFVAGDTFQIMDRDATDANGAKIMIPTVAEPDPLNPGGTQQVIAVDIYIRVLGKPFTCMDIDGYAYDLDQGLWFWSGSVDLNRQPGKPAVKRINELFDVWFCQVDKTTNTCSTTPVELSVFNNVFESYFWNILNNGTRNVQVRLYPRFGNASGKAK